jgi:phosphoribosyl 1,2-cyclic phosphodiesterase
MGLSVRFWGVRGSIACPLPRFMAFGGNTSCVEVRLDDRRIVLDAGTGIRGLGTTYLEENVREAVLLFTHTHWDHVNGFPFFGPAYREDRRFLIRAGHLRDTGGIREVLSGQMNQPMFPVPLEVMRARLAFEDFSAGESFTLDGGVRVRTAPLNHPNGATGYRIEAGGRSVCYVTDTEHRPEQPDRNILGLIEGADLVIYDCTYTDAEFPAKLGWGHSTWQEGVRLCRAAGAKRLAIFHHDPDHDDAFMEALEKSAVAEWDGAFAAREDMVVAVE